MDFLHCGVKSKFKRYFLISQDSFYRYQWLFVANCKKCKQAHYYWQGVLDNGNLGQLRKLKLKEKDAWLKRVEHSLAGEASGNTASEYTKMISCDVAKIHYKVLRKVS